MTLKAFIKKNQHANPATNVTKHSTLAWIFRPLFQNSKFTYELAIVWLGGNGEIFSIGWKWTGTCEWSSISSQTMFMLGIGGGQICRHIFWETWKVSTNILSYILSFTIAWWNDPSPPNSARALALLPVPRTQRGNPRAALGRFGSNSGLGHLRVLKFLSFLQMALHKHTWSERTTRSLQPPPAWGWALRAELPGEAASGGRGRRRPQTGNRARGRRLWGEGRGRYQQLSRATKLHGCARSVRRCAMSPGRAGPLRLGRCRATAAEAVPAAVTKGREGQARACNRWRCPALPEATVFPGGGPHTGE